MCVAGKSIARLLTYVGGVENTGDAPAQQPAQQARDGKRSLKGFIKGKGSGGPRDEGATGGGTGGEWGRFNTAHVWEFVGGADDAGRGDGVLEVDALTGAIFVRGEI